MAIVYGMDACRIFPRENVEMTTGDIVFYGACMILWVFLLEKFIL